MSASRHQLYLGLALSILALLFVGTGYYDSLDRIAEQEVRIGQLQENVSSWQKPLLWAEERSLQKVQVPGGKAIEVSYEVFNAGDREAERGTVLCTVVVGEDHTVIEHPFIIGAVGARSSYRDVADIRVDAMDVEIEGEIDRSASYCDVQICADCRLLESRVR